MKCSKAVRISTDLGGLSCFLIICVVYRQLKVNDLSSVCYVDFGVPVYHIVESVQWTQHHGFSQCFANQNVRSRYCFLETFISTFMASKLAKQMISLLMFTLLKSFSQNKKTNVIR